MLPLYMLEDGQVKEALFVFQGQEHDPLSASRGGCVDDNRFSGGFLPRSHVLSTLYHRS